MGRLLRLSPGYFRAYSALKPRGTARSALAVIASRLSSDRLPGAEDFEALRWPVGVAWAREVKGEMLWVLYALDDTYVTLQELRTAKPVRVRE